MGYNIAAAMWVDEHSKTLVLAGLLLGVGVVILGPPLIGRAILHHGGMPRVLPVVPNGGLGFFEGDNSITVPLPALSAPEVPTSSAPLAQPVEEQPEAVQEPTPQPEVDPYLRVEVPASESEPMPLAAVAFDRLVRSGALTGVGQDVEAQMPEWGYVDSEFDWTWDWKLRQILDLGSEQQYHDGRMAAVSVRVREVEPEMVPAAASAVPVQAGLEHGDHLGQPQHVGHGSITSCAVQRLGLTPSPRDRFIERNRGPRLIRLPWMAGDGLVSAGASIAAAGAGNPHPGEV